MATIIGGSGNDTLVGTISNDTLNGLGGNDTLNGDLGNDTYLFGKGDGQDTLKASNYDISAGKLNTIQFKSGVLVSEVSARRSGDALILEIIGTGDRISVEYFFYSNDPANGYNGLQQVKFADGTVWNLDKIRAQAFIGNENDESFVGTNLADTIDAKAGNDVLNGGLGNDVYLFGRGDGQDTLLETGYDTAAGKLNTIQFKAGVLESDVEAWRTGDHLYVGIKGTSDQIKVEYFFYNNDPSNGYNGLQQIKFASGVAWDLDRIRAKAFIGNENDESFVGTNLADTIDAKEGSDVLNGGLGNDVYLFGRGDGQDILQSTNYDTAAGKLNTIQFKAAVLESDIAAWRDGDHLFLGIKGTSDQIKVEYFFYSNNPSNGYNGLQQVKFSSGVTWDLDRIRAQAFIGNENDESFIGTDLADIIDAKAGNDMLNGGLANDTYLFGRGDGQDTLQSSNYDTAAGKLNTIQFKAGITSSDIFARRSGDHLYIGIKGTSDQIKVEYFFYSNDPTNGYNGLQQVKFADGTAWSLDRITAQAFIGTTGNESFVGTNGADVIDGKAGNDILNGGLGNDTYLFGRGDGQDTLQGTNYDTAAGKLNTLQFKSGVLVSDVWARRVGDQLILRIKGASDQVKVDNFFYSHSPSNGYNGLQQVKFADGTLWNLDRISAQAFIGNAGNESFVGTSGADTIDGKAGNDILNGGLGNDTYLFGKGDGQDTLQETSYDTLAGKLNTIQFKSGVAAADIVASRVGNQLLLRIKATSDQIKVESFFYNNDPTNGYNGLQQVKFADGTAWNLDAIRNQAFKGSTGDDALIGTNFDDVMMGGLGNDILDGLAGNDTLDGGVGVDTLRGGIGDDIYVIDNPNDVIVENANAGIDRVNTSITYTAATNIENVTLIGASSISATGNLVANVLVGNDAANTIIGLDGDDTLRGAAGNDNLQGGNGNDLLEGGLGDDILWGGAGNDTYMFGKTHGADMLNNAGSLLTDTDYVNLGAGIAAGQVWLQHVGVDLKISLIETGDALTVKGWYSGNQNHVDAFVLSNNKRLLESNVENLVSAMAAFAPPASGQASLPANYQAVLNPIIAANWV